MHTVLNPPLTDELVDELIDLWLAVTDAGGAVGFVAPVDRDTVAREVAPFWDRVIDGVTDVVVALDDGVAIGLGFLSPATDPLVAPHRGEVQKLMRAPSSAGRGVGAAVLEALEDRARERGMDLLTLTVRGGTGREAFYEAHGYRVVARLPGWLEVAGERLDSLVLARSLGSAAVPPGRERVAAAPHGGERPLELPVTRLDPDLPLPRYARPGDAGLDLLAREDRVLPPGTRCLMPTGIAVAIPRGWVGLVHPRSGLAVRQGLSIVNSPGTIDAGYRGELMVPLINHDPSTTIRLSRGDRIAQLLLQPVARADLVEVEELPDAERGDDGFGSTGR